MHFLEKKEKEEKEEIKIFLSYNVSTLFLMKPLTGIYLNDFIVAGGIRTYIYFEGKEGLFLLFKETDSYDELLFSQRNNINFVEERVYGEQSVWEYKIPESLSKDFEKLKQGRYSELSPWYKKQYDRMLNISPNRVTESLQWLVFSKSEKFRNQMEKFVGEKIDKKQEVYEILNVEKETLIL